MTDAKLASIYRRRHPEEVSMIAGYPIASKDLHLIDDIHQRFTEELTMDHEMVRLIFVGVVLKKFSPFTLMESLEMEPGVAPVLARLLKVHKNTITSYSKTAYVFYKNNKGFRRDVDSYSEGV